ncbi:MAG: Colicin production protein [Candidatus Saccharibacteria bacterium]|nr:Colicin production protein [Candidatus Saccharibacteria bacterium]
MNILTGVLAVAIVLAALRGYQKGFSQSAFPSLGLIAGILAGAWLAPHLAKDVYAATDRLVITLLCAAFLACIGTILGELFAHRLEALGERLHLHRLNAIMGGIFQTEMVLLIIWLLAPLFVNIETYGLGRQVQQSYIVRGLNAALPVSPDIVARLEKVITPNGFPNVFLGGEPRQALVNPGEKVTAAQIAAAEQSVVQIIGSGCGGEVEGSGFVSAPKTVVTNAHVVAGVKHPYIVYGGERIGVSVVYFDANTDVAVLHAEELRAPALLFEPKRQADNTTDAILGYPGGGPLTVSDAVVLDQLTAVGRDIYNRGTVSRSIYELAANIEPGNSGGPLITADGKVSGIVFAKSASQDSVGYALTIAELTDAINAAASKTAAVSTGACVPD